MRRAFAVLIAVAATAVTTAVSIAISSPWAYATSAVASGARAIRSVDFRSGFTYDLGDAGKVTVRDGSFERTADPASGDALFLDVIDVDHGDLSGDGIEEAVVTLSENTGGTGQFTWSQIYRWTGSRVELVTETGVGDRADGGVHDVLLVSGELVDERYGGDQGACCPTFIERRTFRLRSTGALVLVGSPSRRAYVYAAAGESTTVRFLRGTTRATALMEQGATVTLDAAKGQRLTVSMPGVRPGRSPLVVSVVRPGGATLGSVRAPGSVTVTLPAAGRYELRAATGPSFGPVDVTIR
jgi:hypothetical protein